jgi:hypothetical protein
VTTTVLGLLTDAALSWLVRTVNTSLGSDVLSVSDDDGVSVGLAVAGQPKVVVDHLTTAGGISGRLHIDGLDASPLSVDLFGDFTVALTAFDVTVAHGGIAALNIAGALTIPYFTNRDGSARTVDIEVSVRSDGTLAVTLAAQQSGSTSPDGLLQLHYELPLDATIDLSVAALEVDRDTAGVWKLTISGSLALGTGSVAGQQPLAWPSVDLRGLSIDSAGNVSLEGGWIDLPSQAALDFYGFHIALQQLGLGNDATGHWIGFTGDINLVEGLSLGGSVRGLQINLDTGAVSFTGVGIDFEIPGVISFTGDVEHLHLDPGADPTTQGLPAGFHTPADIFAGGVDVDIEVADLQIQGTFIVAHVPVDGADVPCFFLTLDAELPVGIPLFLDVALYGLSGLFATNLYPTVGSDTWWNWFKYPTVDGAPADDQGADYTASDPRKWLNPRPGAFALGAGATIGTQDDGFTASAAVAFMIIMPGPVFALIGRANILSKRIDGPSGPANFDALATFDGNTGVFDLVIDARYSIPVVLDISGSAELYVDAGSGVWFLALGRPPHEKRIQARILDLFESDAYLVASNTGLVAGFWIGYRNSWSFGPLSVSIDAYLAGQGAIQWSPFQIAAGVELHGEVHLDAFGIGLGLTADALLEATAPNPWWVYGSFQVEIDLPWPLPNVGATVSLSWGGDDGSVPPAPLALNVVNATLADHGASDRYELLAHRPLATVNQGAPGDTVTYDSGAPGILAADPPGYWVARYPTVAVDPSQVLPDLRPEQLARVALVPQDSHFSLTFAHPVSDTIGFTGHLGVAPDAARVSMPSIVGVDDMSNIDPTPPAVQWLITHSLLEVALFQYDSDAEEWDLVAAAPQGGAPRPLVGAWVAPDPTHNGAKPMTALRVSPSTAGDGQSYSASWSRPPATLGTTFIDSDLGFDCGPGFSPVTITTVAGLPAGLRFEGQGLVTITFPTAVTLEGLSGVALRGSAVAAAVAGPPQVLDPNEDPLPTVASSADSTGLWTLEFDPSKSPVTSIKLLVTSGSVQLMALWYSTPDVDLAILPQAPGLYALKTVTQIMAGRADSSGNAAYQPVADGDPVIEFAYFQCASGPGTAGTAPGPVGPSGYASPLPFQEAPQPGLVVPAGSPASAFPTGGRLNDLATYTQWSWPGDGDPSAYFGYDIGVEFDETYVVALYTAFGAAVASHAVYRGVGGIPLHFRCVDRNNAHVLIVPSATSVPSVPQQSALMGAVVEPAIPDVVDAPTTSGGFTGFAGGYTRPPNEAHGVVVQAASGAPGALRGAVELLDAAHRAVLTRLDVRSPVGPQAVPTAPTSPSPAAVAVLTAAAAAVGVHGGTGLLQAGLMVRPGAYEDIAHELAERQAAAQVHARWFTTLAPSTRYTLDVVAGALADSRGRASQAAGSIGAVFAQPDALGTSAALDAFLGREDALTTLQRVQFTTSRYATFADHVAHVGAQLAGTSSTPVRRYAAPGDLSAADWLATGTNDGSRPDPIAAYQQARSDLAAMVGRFGPLYDETTPPQPADPGSGNGQAALAAQRAGTERAWRVFSTAISATFDALVAVLGRPDLASDQKVAAPPDTELSLLTVDGDSRVTALLLESPEPLPWRRLWPWVRLDPVGARFTAYRPVAPPAPTVFWSTDGTRALIVPGVDSSGAGPVGHYDLVLTFQGDIGAEVACITRGGVGVTDAVDVGTIRLAPDAPVWFHPVLGREFDGPFR